MNKHDLTYQWTGPGPIYPLIMIPNTNRRGRGPIPNNHKLYICVYHINTTSMVSAACSQITVITTPYFVYLLNINKDYIESAIMCCMTHFDGKFYVPYIF